MMGENIKVMIRCRPFNQQQIEKGCKNIITITNQTHQIGIKKPQNSSQIVKYFAFDNVFDEKVTQQQVYQQTTFTLVEKVLTGYNGTIFAYGQTGCGKTHTMMGGTISSKKCSSMNRTRQNLRTTVASLKLESSTMGIIPRAFNQIMTVTNSQQNKKHLIHCSFIEIYNQEIHDLLGKDIRSKLLLQETPEGLTVKDLSVHQARSIADMEKFMEIGYKNRVIRETNMNKESSRSHCIFTIRIEESQINQEGVEKFKVGKLNLVDLAGSERQSKTNLKDNGIKEAAKINLSLSALGNVISALADGKSQHIPYRDSKLTRLLNDSLGGNTKTVMIANIAPTDLNYEQTLSTLRYASRAKFIQNKPVINEDPKDALLRKYEEQIKRLRMILEGKLPFVKGNETFYIKEQPKQINIFKKFPQLLNEQNEAMFHSINQEKQKAQQRMVQRQHNTENSGRKLNTKDESQRKIQSKNKIKKQLQFLEKVVNKQALNMPQAEQLAKIEELKARLKEQEQKQRKYKLQQLKKDEQLLTIEKNYKNLNQEVEIMKKKFQDLRQKYLQKTQEIHDVRQANEKEKQDILDALRIQEAQNNKLMEILNVIVPEQNLQKLFNHCQWKQETQQWTVPKFYFTEQREIILPLLGEKIKRKEKYCNTQIKESKESESKQKTDDQSEIQQQNSKQIQKNILEQNLGRNQKMQTVNLFFQQSQKSNFKMRSVQSQKKITIRSSRKELPRGNSLRSGREKTEKQEKKTFKTSYYSQNNQTNLGQEQMKMMDKYKFSLKPIQKIAKLPIQKEKPIKVKVDLETLKAQIMNELKANQKRKTAQ